MTVLSGLGIVLSLVFGCLLLALVAELYYLLWWKRHGLISGNNNSQRIEDDYSNHTKEMFYLFCWDKQPSSVITNSNNNHNNNNHHLIAASPCDANDEHDPDLEMGLGGKDLLLRAFGEESVESELMRLHNLAGPPRFLFTIKEETKEDLVESEDGRSKRGGSRTKSLGDLIVALDAQSPFLMSPMASPPMFSSNYNYDNPLFESSAASVEAAELLRLRSSPPPKFKFLRDAEEKLYRRLLEEAQRKSGVLQQQEVNHNINNVEVNNKHIDAVHCSSQVLPLDSSPQLSSVEKKPSLH